MSDRGELHTRCAVVRREADGILTVTFSAGAIVDEDDAAAIAAAREQLGSPDLVLVDSRGIASATRASFESAVPSPPPRALAILVEGTVSVFLGNFLVRVVGRSYPVRLFRDADEARGWLLDR